MIFMLIAAMLFPHSSFASVTSCNGAVDSVRATILGFTTGEPTVMRFRPSPNSEPVSSQKKTFTSKELPLCGHISNSSMLAAFTTMLYPSIKGKDDAEVGICLAGNNCVSEIKRFKVRQ